MTGGGLTLRDRWGRASRASDVRWRDWLVPAFTALARHKNGTVVGPTDATSAAAASLFTVPVALSRRRRAGWVRSAQRRYSVRRMAAAPSTT